jgi:hypothetical protein
MTAVVDAAGLTEEQYIRLLREKEQEKEKISDINNQEYKRMEFYITLLKSSPGHFHSDYTLNRQINTVVNKLKFIDKFNL